MANHVLMKSEGSQGQPEKGVLDEADKLLYEGSTQ